MIPGSTYSPGSVRWLLFLPAAFLAGYAVVRASVVMGIAQTLGHPAQIMNFFAAFAAGFAFMFVGVMIAPSRRKVVAACFVFYMLFINWPFIGPLLLRGTPVSETFLAMTYLAGGIVAAALASRALHEAPDAVNTDRRTLVSDGELADRQRLAAIGQAPGAQGPPARLRPRSARYPRARKVAIGLGVFYALQYILAGLGPVLAPGGADAGTHLLFGFVVILFGMLRFFLTAGIIYGLLWVVLASWDAFRAGLHGTPAQRAARQRLDAIGQADPRLAAIDQSSGGRGRGSQVAGGLGWSRWNWIGMRRVTKKRVLVVVAMLVALYVTSPTVWLPWDGGYGVSTSGFGVILRTPHLRLLFLNFNALHPGYIAPGYSVFARGFTFCHDPSANLSATDQVRFCLMQDDQ